MSVVATNQLADFLTPTNATLDDADQVRGNDNTLRAAFNVHDADIGIHFQSSALAARPVAGVLGRVWLTTNEGRIYYDDGANWQEIAYAKLASPTFTGTVTAANLTVTGAVANSLTLAGTASITLSNAAGGLVQSSVPTALTFSLGPYSALTGSYIQLQSPHAVQLPPGSVGPILIGGVGGAGMGDVNVFSGVAKKTTLGPTGAAQIEVRPDNKIYYGGSVLFDSVLPVWALPTGTVSRATFDQSTVTLAQLAQRVAAFILDLKTTHGLLA